MFVMAGAGCWLSSALPPKAAVLNVPVRLIPKLSLSIVFPKALFVITHSSYVKYYAVLFINIRLISGFY